MHWIDPDSVPASSHVLSRFLANGHGHVDGFIDAQGLQIHFPPHLGAVMTRRVKVGETVQVRGVRPRGAPVLVALQVTPATGKPIVDEGPHGHHAPPQPLPPNAHHVELSGTVAQALYGPRGECNGVLLEDGVIVRFDHHFAETVATLLHPGVALSAEGDVRKTRVGTVLDASYLWESDAAVPAP